MTPSDLNSLNKEERKELVDKMSKVANKRLERLSNLELPSQAFSSRQEHNERGQKIRYSDGQWAYREFQSAGKTNNQLGNELKFLQMFLRNKTSTVTGANRSAKEIYSRVLNTPKSKVNLSAISYDQAKEFWEGYQKVMESNIGIISTKENPLAGRLTSSQVQQAIYDMYQQNSFALDSDQLYERAQEFIDADYETRDRRI